MPTARSSKATRFRPASITPASARHSWLNDTGRVTYQPITDTEALEAFQLCTRLEGIIPALESAHGLAQVMKIAPTMGKDETIVLCLSGRGDKDVESVGRYLSQQN